MFNNARPLSPEQELLSKIRKSPKSLTTFIQRVAQNRKIAEQLPQHHAFMSSLANFYGVRGILTDKQKFAANKEIEKFAPVYVQVMTFNAQPAQKSEEQIEREGMQSENVEDSFDGPPAEHSEAPLPEE